MLTSSVLTSQTFGCTCAGGINLIQPSVSRNIWFYWAYAPLYLLRLNYNTSVTVAEFDSMGHIALHQLKLVPSTNSYIRGAKIRRERAWWRV